MNGCAVRPPWSSGVLTKAGRELLREARHLLAAAGDLECRVRQVAKACEAEPVIAINDLRPLLHLLATFYAEHGETRLRILRESLSGTWDALVHGRADLVVGARVTRRRATGPAAARGGQSA